MLSRCHPWHDLLRGPVPGTLRQVARAALRASAKEHPRPTATFWIWGRETARVRAYVRAAVFSARATLIPYALGRV